jgi:acetyl esterase/lipase
MNKSSILYPVLVLALFYGTPLPAVELPPEMPLWEKPPLDYAIPKDVTEQVRSVPPRAGSPSGLNRAFSSVSLPTYSIHRPANPNGVGLVICPGGGFRDVWLDREGHDLAIWLKGHGVTSLVLKYRTFVAAEKSPANTWQNYQRAVQADGRQAIRILRKRASELGLQPNKIGICGFSAGGHLAISCSIYPEPKRPETEVSGMPDFAGLFYPGIPDDVGQVIESRTAPGSVTPGICPLFIMNARDDQLTPAEKCVEFYAMLLKAGVKAELHVFGKGSHGFDLGTGRGKSAEIWPTSFVAWLSDLGMIEN